MRVDLKERKKRRREGEWEGERQPGRKVKELRRGNKIERERARGKGEGWRETYGDK